MKPRFSFVLLILLSSCCPDLRELNEDEQFVLDFYLNWIQGEGIESLESVLDINEYITAEELIKYSLTSRYLVCDTDTNIRGMASAEFETQTVKIYTKHEAWKTVILPNIQGQYNWWINCNTQNFGHKMEVATSILCHENAHFIMGYNTSHDIIYEIDDQCRWAWMYYQSQYETSCVKP